MDDSDRYGQKRRLEGSGDFMDVDEDEECYGGGWFGDEAHEGSAMRKRNLAMHPPASLLDEVNPMNAVRGRRKYDEIFSNHSDNIVKRVDRKRQEMIIEEKVPEPKRNLINVYDQDNLHLEVERKAQSRLKQNRKSKRQAQNREMLIQGLREELRPRIEARLLGRSPMDILTDISPEIMKGWNGKKSGLSRILRTILRKFHPDRQSDQSDEQQVYCEEMYKIVVEIKEKLGI